MNSIPALTASLFPAILGGANITSHGTMLGVVVAVVLGTASYFMLRAPRFARA